MNQEERDWSAWAVPVHMRDQGMAVVVAALREFGVDVKVHKWHGHNRFTCEPEPGEDVILRAINIGRQAIGVPAFESNEDRHAYNMWTIHNTLAEMRSK